MLRPPNNKISTVVINMINNRIFRMKYKDNSNHKITINNHLIKIRISQIIMSNSNNWKKRKE